MKRLWSWWTRWWFQPLDPRPLALFRIAFGAVLVLFYVALAPNWDAYYGANGILSLRDADVAAQMPRLDPWSLFTWTPAWLPIRAYWWVGLLAALAFAAGYWTRLAAGVLYVLQTSLGHCTSVVVNGEDSMFRWMLLFSLFMTLDSGWSLRRRQAPSKPAAAWPVRLAQVNVAAIYLFSVWDKLLDPAGYWVRGEAVYYALTTKLWGSGWPWLRWFYGDTGVLLNHLATYGSLAVEIGFPLLIWFRRARPVVLLSAVLLHLTLAALIPGIRFFNAAMICCLALYLPQPQGRAS